MDDFKEEFIFTLVKPFPYHDKGTETLCTELILKAPSNKQRRQTAKLKQGFFRALPKDDGQDKGKGSGDGKITGTQIITIIMMSQEVDLGEYQESFRDLLLNGGAMVNDSQKLTAPLYDNMCDQDTQKLMGEYIATFLLSSWMESLQKI